MADRTAGTKIVPTRKLKRENGPSTRQAVPRGAPSPLESAITELKGLHELLLSGDLDPRVLADFRDALNRVRTVDGPVSWLSGPVLSWPACCKASILKSQALLQRGSYLRPRAPAP